MKKFIAILYFFIFFVMFYFVVIYVCLFNKKYAPIWWASLGSFAICTFLGIKDSEVEE